MKKNEFVRLAVKVIGFTILLPAIQVIISLTIHYITVIGSFYDHPDADRFVSLHLVSILPRLIGDVISVIIAGYFLFFGRKVSRIIENRVKCIDDNKISLTEAALVTVRAAGVWFFTKAIFFLAAGFLYPIESGLAKMIILKQREAETAISFWPDPRMLIITIMFVLIYIAIAIYLLRAGNFFARFLTKNKNELPQNQISQSPL